MGGLYAFDFARRMPSVARQGVFDMSIYHYGPAVGRESARQTRLPFRP
jgi:hypothetical protein